MENFEHKPGEPKYLKPEELKTWHEMKDIFDSYNSNLSKISLEKMDEIQDKIIDLKKRLEEKGINPYKYLLFHDLIGSGVSKVELELDTENRDIEKFIRELYADYK